VEANRLRLVAGTIVVLIALCVTLSGHSIGAEEKLFTVQLSEFTGWLNTHQSCRTQVVDLDTNLDSVLSVKLHIGGVMFPGIGQGDGLISPGTETFPWMTQIEASMDNEGFGMWVHYGGPYTGEFNDSLPLESYFGADWDFFLDGEAEVSICLAPAIMIGAIQIQPSEAHIDSAFLVVDAIVDQTTDVKDVAEIVPTGFALGQNYPNPFNSSTQISYNLLQPGRVELSIHNSLGQLVKTLTNESKPVGAHTCLWDGTDSRGRQVPSGVYFYRLSSANRLESRKMILLK